MHLYIHVPFCKCKCPYCAFFSRPLSELHDDSLAIWEAFILKEMRLYCAVFPEQPLETIFFGGGTPSLVQPSSIDGILNEAVKLFPSSDAMEVSLEANPESISPEKARGYKATGINRISMGIQSLDDHLLRSIGRPHTKRQALEAYGSLRDAGFANIGLDLMWGLPGESLGSWLSQLEEAANLTPEHLSCYGLTLEPGTPFGNKLPSLPPDDVLSAMYMECGAVLEGFGYEQYEVSNYAMPGFACRHNTGYWHGKDYLGLGPSSVSTRGRKRWTQPADIAAWIAGIRDGKLFPQQEDLSVQETAEEYIMLRLRMAEGMTLSGLQAVAGQSCTAKIQEFWQVLEKENLAAITDDRLFLTRRGMLISNAIIERLFEEIH